MDYQVRKVQPNRSRSIIIITGTGTDLAHPIFLLWFLLFQIRDRINLTLYFEACEYFVMSVNMNMSVETTFYYGNGS